jgi:hypothetical protein
MKVNYVIATWSGERRDSFPPQQENKLYYLINHLYSLKRLHHNLDQITIVAPINAEEDSSFTRFLARVPRKIRNTDVVVLSRENLNQSYGSYYYAHQIFGDEFKYYILIEDDYIFAKDDFDKIIINEFEAKQNCGFLCTYADFFDPENKTWYHAAISNGITSHECLDKVRKFDFGGKEELLGEKYCNGHYDVIPQIRFSTNFIAAGTELHDLAHKYRAAYHATRHKKNELLFFGDETKEDLILPLQWAEYFGIPTINDSSLV